MAVALVLAACVGPDARAEQSNGRTVLVQSRDDGGADAAIGGEVGVNDRGCYGLTRYDGSVGVVIWPRGYGITDDGELRAADGSVLREGDVIQGGGGEADFRATYGDLADLCVDDAAGADVKVSVIDVVGDGPVEPIQPDPAD